jgi:hypothetical protein
MELLFSSRKQSFYWPHWISEVDLAQMAMLDRDYGQIMVKQRRTCSKLGQPHAGTHDRYHKYVP